MPYLIIRLFTIYFLKSANAIVPKYYFKCLPEVFWLVEVHKYSSRNAIKLSYTMHPNLIGDAECNICWNFSSIIRWCKVKAATHNSTNDINITEEPSKKKARRSIYDALEEEMSQFKHRQPLQNLHCRNRHLQINQFAMQILATEFSIDCFKDSCFNYLQEGKEEIATNASHVLSITTKRNLKRIRFDIKSQFESCILLPPC